MLTPFRKPVRQKALLAIAFASGMVHSLQPALSQPPSESTKTVEQSSSTDSVARQIANSGLATPEIRAYYLLRLAQDCLTNRAQDGGAQLKKTFETYTKISSNSQFFRLRNGQDMLESFADEFFYGGMKTVNARSVRKEDSACAEIATIEALGQLSQASQKYDKLTMYLIASRLFERTGNRAEMRRCDAIVNAAIQSCERSATSDEEELKCIASILNSMAYGLIPVRAPERESEWSQQSAEVNAVTAEEFKKSEVLKLRALALVDRLQSTNFSRRKAHRDLALWYLQLGKPILAEKQKQILFELVGRKDESLMFPSVVSCGQLDWFPPPAKTPRLIGACGMG